MYKFIVGDFRRQSNKSLCSIYTQNRDSLIERNAGIAHNRQRVSSSERRLGNCGHLAVVSELVLPLLSHGPHLATTQELLTCTQTCTREGGEGGEGGRVSEKACLLQHG